MYRFMWKLFFATNILSLLGPAAQAYIPTSQFVLDQTAKNHGKGAYSMDVEVSIPNGSDHYVVSEHWQILSPTQMLLTAKGPGFRLHTLYVENQKYLIEETGSQKTNTASIEFFEPYFLVRNPATLSRYLVATQIVSNAQLQAKRPLPNLKEFKSVPEPFVRLTRTGGVPCITFGEPTPLDAARANPTLWIEQDRFIIRRLRLNTQAEIAADEYNEYGRGLWFPRLRTLSWEGGSTVKMVVRRLDAKNETDAFKKSFVVSAFLANKDHKSVQQEAPAPVREFYQRFR